MTLSVLALAIFGLSGFSAVAEPQPVKMASPAASFDEPRRIILQLSTDDSVAVNSILYNAINIQKFYGMDNVEISIIAFGPGMKSLYTDSSPVPDRISSLMKYGIEFVGCGNTMDAQGRQASDLLAGVTYVQAGIPEIVERQLQGWVYVHP
jgi:hypothetical protein